MAEVDLNIIIGAKVDNALRGLKEVQDYLNSASAAGQKFSKSTAAAGAAVGKTTKDFTGLSRVIQDLPYGFNAISNNLTQLVPAAGAAGLAFSAIVAAVTFAQVGFSAWTRGMGQSKEQLDEVSKSLAGAQTEIVKISSLLSIARGLGETTEARTNAIKELQKEYPGYLSNLNLENINSQETSHSIDLLSQALLRKARVQAVSNLLTKANEKLLKAENATITENILSVNTFLQLLKGGIFTPGTAGGSIVRGATKETVENIAEAAEEVKNLTNQLAELTQAQAREGEFTLLNPTKIREAKEKLKKEFNYYTFDPSIVNLDFDATVFHGTENLTKNIQNALDKGPGIKVPPFDFSLTELGKRSAEAAEIIRGTLEGAIESVGEVIGNLITGQKNPFAAFFTVVGEGLKALGKSLIVVGKLAESIRTALASIIANPVAAITVGIAAIALGSVIANIGKSSISKFATGGVVTRPTLALVGEQGPERITPLGQIQNQNSMMAGEVVFQINGNTLRGVLRRADQSAYNTF